MRTADAVSTSLFKPKEKKPSVSFEIDTIHEENEARREKEKEKEEARKAEIRKGNQPAHTSPESMTQPGSLFGKRPTEVPTPAQNPTWKRPDATPQPPTQHEREREAREAAYAKPPSIHTDNKIPQNAPPVEKLLQFGSNNVPITSLGVLTPTEQRKLQVGYYHMRNILLDRSQKCPYRGCDRVIAIGDDDRMQKHLRDAHMGDGCNFCDEVLYEHWTINQRRAHFLKCHSDLFLRRTHVQDNNSFRAHARPHGRVDYDRESRWSYCPRCGRDHNALTAKADREHHDSVCYPGAPKGDWVVCTKCGVFHSKMEYHRECRKNVNTLEYPYCNTCGLGQGLFSDLYHGTHQLHCKPIRSDDPKYCPWCGIELIGSLDQRRFHHDNCEYSPNATAEGPIDGETGQIWLPKPPIEEQEPEPEQEPPEMCTLCKKGLIGVDAHLIQKHIDDEHGDYSTRCCIFCKLNYETRGWADDRQQILLHLDDHIHDRKEKMAADLVVTLGKLPWNHPFKMKPLRPTDYAAVRDLREAEETKEIYGNLWESTRKLIDEMNEDKRTITELRKELRAAKEKPGESSEQVSRPTPAPAPRTLPPNPFGPKQTDAPADAPVTPAGPVTGSTLALGPPATEQTAAHRARFNPFAPKQTAAPPPAQTTPAGLTTGSVFGPTPPTTNQKKITDKGKGKEKEVAKAPGIKTIH
ncbi:hypothetical protein GE09DRAFT_10645 [Coniochaeta sp. 2T2.1]|nr:hypothetical protein GE09DRAFT_10645 [Coniochaeta sp. 2T2.1]